MEKGTTQVPSPHHTKPPSRHIHWKRGREHLQEFSLSPSRGGDAVPFPDAAPREEGSARAPAAGSDPRDTEEVPVAITKRHELSRNPSRAKGHTPSQPG